ncbi:putative uncharacterized protein CXorf58 [Trichoplax sp. H2]|nr:putative uncharacterized protein CXorf58 [Trichoplax sp. H2]|eukprot:RDD39242.1 putative uncharacterized protein CXorf58 [Trichoplax sp. H2]
MNPEFSRMQNYPIATAGTYQSSWTEPFADSAATNENRGITALEIAQKNSKNKAINYSNDHYFRRYSFSTVEILAVRVIEKCWWSYRDRQVFKLLKDALCKAETSISFDVIRKICPTESELLKDKALSAKIRFRFGGQEFPPSILFKIYIDRRNLGVKYYNGRTIIKPASQAAADACKMMGYRKFYDQMIADAWDRECHEITDEIDVVTLQDYLKFQSNLDEKEAAKGGKENLWRRLSLENVPRHHIMHDVLSYMATGVITRKLVDQAPQMVDYYVPNSGLPLGPPILAQTPLSATTSNDRAGLPTNHETSQSKRRSRRAQKRVASMRKNYLNQDFESNEPNNDNKRQSNQVIGYRGTQQDRKSTSRTNIDDIIFEGNEWEEQAGELYEWSKGLSYDDDIN